MSIPLVATPPPPTPAITDLLTGPSSTFVATIGNWTANGTGTTVTFDSAKGIDSTRGSAKVHTTLNDVTRYAEVAIPGTFKAGVIYHAVVAFTHDALAANAYIYYGLRLGNNSDSNTAAFYVADGAAAVSGGRADPAVINAAIVTWTPSIDRTGVTLRFTRDVYGDPSAHDAWIVEARVAVGEHNKPGLAGLNYLNSMGSPTKGFITVPLGDAYGGFGGTTAGYPYVHGFFINERGAFLQGHSDGTNDTSGLYVNEDGVYVYGTQKFGIGRRSRAWNEEYGPDYVGLYKGERSATEVDIYPDGNYDMYLLDGHVDGDTGHWWHEEADGTYKASAGRKSRVGMYFQQTFHLTGAQTTGTAKNEPAEYFQMPFPAEIDEVRVHLGTAPTGATFLVDVNINGTTIFTTQANRPTVAISATDATSGAPDTTKFAKNDRLSFDVDQVGSTIAGSDLTVMVRGRYLW